MDTVQVGDIKVRIDVEKNPSFESLRMRALEQRVRKTKIGSLAVSSNTRSRSADKLEIIWDTPNAQQKKEIASALDYMQAHKTIRMDRIIGQGSTHLCRLYVSSDYPHIALYWGSMLFGGVISPKEKPSFVTISIPEWRQQRIYVFPRSGITLLLGIDYMGEHKMSFLRQYLWAVKQKGMLGMHAASKVLRIHTPSGSLGNKGVLLLGLSGTGKTTLSVDSHGLQWPESVIIRQDDIVTLASDSRALGTEKNLYVKTEGVSPQNQPLLYRAVSSSEALLENVMIRADGTPDFQDTSYTANARAIIDRTALAPYIDASVDLARVDCIFFITRRNDIVPPVVKLSREWAGLAFMLGESTETSAGDPTKAGKSVRVVGMNPFIMGSPAAEGNRFLALLEKNPHIECFLLNTGMVGEREKITPTDSARIMLEVVRGNIRWKKQPNSFWGYTEPELIPGITLSRFALPLFYTDEEMRVLQELLLKERRAWIEKFVPELDARIVACLGKK
jgi:phosphoenolpyruvate carboxykinase (ATP)